MEVREIRVVSRVLERDIEIFYSLSFWWPLGNYPERKKVTIENVKFSFFLSFPRLLCSFEVF